jgi:hypothetical protein
MSASKVKMIFLALSPLFLLILYFTLRFEMGGYLNSVNVAGTPFPPDTVLRGNSQSQSLMGSPVPSTI